MVILIIDIWKITFGTSKTNLLNAIPYIINNDFITFERASFRGLVIEIFDFIKNVTTFTVSIR